MKCHVAKDIFKKIAQELEDYKNSKEKNQLFTIDYNNELISFTIIDRYATNRLLAAGYKEKTALLFSSVLHEITLIIMIVKAFV